MIKYLTIICLVVQAILIVIIILNFNYLYPEPEIITIKSECPVPIECPKEIECPICVVCPECKESGCSIACCMKLYQKIKDDF